MSAENQPNSPAQPPSPTNPAADDVRPRQGGGAAKHLHWTTIAIDLAVVVIGVFIGMQATNWNQNRLDHQRETEYIARLTRDFDKIDARLTDNIERLQVIADAPLRVLADIKAFRSQGQWPRPKQAILEDLSKTLQNRIPAPRAATFVELLSAGQLGLIRNTGLRDALLDYDMREGFAQKAFDVIVQNNAPHMDALLAHLEFDPRSNLGTSGDARFPRIWADVDLPGLGTDPKVVTALNMYAFSSSNQLLLANVQRNKAREVMVILKSDAAANR